MIFVIGLFKITVFGAFCLLVQAATYLVTFPKPLYQLITLPCCNLLRRGGVKFFSNFLVAQVLIVQELTIPYRVQVCSIAFVRYHYCVAAFIFGAAHMHRLM